MVPNFQSYDGGEHMFSYKRSKFAYVCTRPMFRCLGVGWLVGVVKGLGGGHFPRSPEGAGGQGVRGQGVRGSGVRGGNCPMELVTSYVTKPLRNCNNKKT